MSARLEKWRSAFIAGKDNRPRRGGKAYIELGAGTDEEGVICVGDVEGTVVAAPLCVGMAIEGTGTSNNSCLFPPLLMTGLTLSVINIILPSTVIAALKRMRAFG